MLDQQVEDAAGPGPVERVVEVDEGLAERAHASSSLALVVRARGAALPVRELASSLTWPPASRG